MSCGELFLSTDESLLIYWYCAATGNVKLVSRLTLVKFNCVSFLAQYIYGLVLLISCNDFIR